MKKSLAAAPISREHRTPWFSSAQLDLAAATSATKTTIALLGSERFDVNQVDVNSLHFHGARPINVSVVDVNHDGIPDLLLEFPPPDIHLSRDATRVRLTGWLKNSRAFVGETAYGSGCPR